LKTIANLAIDNLKGSDPTNPTDSEQPLEAELEPKQRKQTLALVPNRKTAVRRWAEEELVVKQKELSEAALVYTRLQLEVSALTTILEMV
jgi:hypothetical protein